MKIIQVNNSNLFNIIKEWMEVNKKAPAQHLWGYNMLSQYGIHVSILPFERIPCIKKLSDRLKILGDLDQQLRILQRSHDYDVIYSAHHLTTTLLSFFRMLGLLNKPLLAIAYQSFRRQNLWSRIFARLFIYGNDKILCLSDAVMRDLEKLGIPRKKLDVIEWGFDLKFYNPQETTSGCQPSLQDKKMILSTGKTYRDYATLSRAFRQIDADLEIFASGQQPFQKTFDSPPNVKVAPSRIHWTDIIQKYRQAYAVAIPILIDPFKLKNSIGLTALLESFAMGKAVVMTRNEYVGVDLEKENVGIWVDPGDSQGWRQAIQYLLDHPDIVMDMGKRARRLAEKKFNLESFSYKLSVHLKDLAQSR